MRAASLPATAMDSFVATAGARRGRGAGFAPPPPALQGATFGSMPTSTSTNVISSNGFINGGFAGGAGGSGAKGMHQHYAARQQIMISDERPLVRDFREEADKAAVRGSLMAKKASVAMERADSPMIYGDEGVGAVTNTKANNRLKEVSMIAKDEETAGAIKSVDDKTFYLRNGVWVDSTYTDKLKPQVITFGTSQYFDLLHNNPGIAKYLAVGKEVIFVFKGTIQNRGYCHHIVR